MPASRTAIATLLARAAHQHDDDPVIARDPIAARLVAGLALANTTPSRARDPEDWARLRDHVARRTVHAETALAAAVAERGVAQYVVLGAGYDTFAYRQPSWARDLTVFEVDRPETQSAKRAALLRGGIESPPNLRFVPLDFERDSLPGALAAAGADLEAPCFCSWLGVTVYLSRPAVEATLRAVAGLPGGSEIAFTFARADGPWSAGAAAAGEPWLTFFEEDDLHALVRDAGFDRLEIDGPNALARRDARRLR